MRGRPIDEAELSIGAVELVQRRLYSGAVVEAHPGGGLSGGAMDEYAAGLAFAAHLKAVAVKTETRAGKHRDLQNFEAWLLQHTPRTLFDFRPVDFEAYLAGWLQTRCQGRKPPSGNTVKRLISNVRGEVSMLGREGPWAASGTGEWSFPHECKVATWGARWRGFHSKRREFI